MLIHIRAGLAPTYTLYLQDFRRHSTYNMIFEHNFSVIANLTFLIRNIEGKTLIYEDFNPSNIGYFLPVYEGKTV